MNSDPSSKKPSPQKTPSPAKSDAIAPPLGYNPQLTEENVRKLDPISHIKPLYQQIGEQYYKEDYAPSHHSVAEDNRSYTTETSFGFVPEQPKVIPKFQQILFRRLMDCIRPRGVKGLIGFSRQLNLYDTSKSGSLTEDEFKQALSDYEIDMLDIDIENLFKSFAQETGGKLEISTFMETFIQPMNKNRFSLVKKAWKHLDYQKEGKLPLPYLLHSYDASRHPDVTNYRKDEEEVQYEFTDYWQKKANFSY